MNSSVLHKILSRDSCTIRYFAGVYPSDQIPECLISPAAFVVNTDKHYEQGISHWLAFFMEDDKTVEFFLFFWFAS